LPVAEGIQIITWINQEIQWNVLSKSNCATEGCYIIEYRCRERPILHHPVVDEAVMRGFQLEIEGRYCRLVKLVFVPSHFYGLAAKPQWDFTVTSACIPYPTQADMYSGYHARMNGMKDYSYKRERSVGSDVRWI
jgi:hypothetical protein